MAGPALHIELNQDGQTIRIQGPLDLYHYAEAEKALKDCSAGKAASIDASEITHLDTAGAFLLQAITRQQVSIEHLNPEHKAIFDLIAKAKPGTSPLKKRLSSWIQAIVRLGKATVHIAPATKDFITFMGQACKKLAGTIIHPSRLRVISITHHIEAIGIDAIPIISLIAFTISIVIAYQGQVQLKALGAQQYTVNLVAISVLREMGVLLTAIMIAGRSGSAFTAEIGTMKVRQEIDALRSLGFNPFELLVLPRLMALLVALPLLTVLADIMGLFGGGLISLSLMDIPMPEYLERARHAATWKDFFAGMIKAPVFALIIALVGCMHGLKVSGSAESVGKETTASVVQAIFLVLILDGLFSIYFEKIGL